MSPFFPRRITTFILSLLTAALFADGQQVRAAQPREISVWPGVAPGSEGIEETEVVVERGKGKGSIDRSISSVHQPTITVHLPDRRSKKPCAAMVICPGGGLNRVVIDKEGNDLAKLLAKNGVAGIVLKFRTVKSPTHFYGLAAPVADLQQAIRLTRSRAAEWDIDPERVGVFGFSAGGLVASTAATHFDDGDKSATDPVARQGSRPDFVGLAYPLISLQREVAGEKYQKLTLGAQPTEKQIREYSNELHVTTKTPPAFLAHAADDTGVKIENSKRFAAAYRRAGVPCTTFFRAKGGHGYGIRDLGKPINQWPTAFLAWLKESGFTE